MIGIKELLGLLASAVVFFSSVMVPLGDDSVVAIDRLDDDGLEAIAETPASIHMDGLTLYDPVIVPGDSVLPVSVDGAVERVQGIATTTERASTITFGGERLEVPHGAYVTIKHITGSLDIEKAPIGGDASLHGTATDVSIHPPENPVVTTHNREVAPLPVAEVRLGEQPLATGSEDGGSYESIQITIAHDLQNTVHLVVGAGLLPLQAGATIELIDYVGLVALTSADASHDALHLEGYASVKIGDEKIDQGVDVSATVPLPQGPGLTNEPEASFTYGPGEPLTGDTIQFNDESTHEFALRSWHWDFGDGDTSRDRNPQHAFPAPGTYDVSLTVTDIEGQTDTATDTITVENTAPEVSLDWAPLTPKETEPVNFTADVLDREGDIDAVVWTFPNGDTDTGLEAQHTFNTLGTYKINVVAVDEEGLQDEVEVDVHVQNMPPTVSFEVSPQTPTQGEPATLTSTSQTHGTGQINDWTWTVEGLEDPLQGETTTVTFPAYGELSVTLTVEDDHGDTATLERAIDVLPPPPEIGVTLDPPFPNPGETVTFQAFIETGTNANEATWLFENGVELDGLSVDRVFQDPGEHAVNVTVTDSNGAVNTLEHAFDVNHPPGVTLEVQGEGEVNETARQTGESVTFDASIVDADGNATQETWLVEDLETGTTLPFEDEDACDFTDLTATCTWETKSLKKVILESTDDNGASTKASVIVMVLAQPPDILGISPTTVQVDVEVNIELNLHDPDDAVTKIEWHLDELIGTGKTLVHEFTDPGPKNLLVKVIFHDGDKEQEKETTFPIEAVEGPAVTISVSPSTNVETGVQATFDADAHDPSRPDSSLTYEWDLGDGTTEGNRSSVDHTYTATGSFTVTVTVTNADGVQDDDSVTMQVTLADIEAEIVATPSAPTVGQKVTLEIQHDGNSDTKRVDWTIDGDAHVTSDATIEATFNTPKHIGVNALVETEHGAKGQASMTLRVTAGQAHTIKITPNLPDGKCAREEPTFILNFTNQWTGDTIGLHAEGDPWDPDDDPCQVEATIPADEWSIGDGYVLQGVCSSNHETLDFGDFNANALIQTEFLFQHAPLTLVDVTVTNRTNDAILLENSEDSTTYHDPLEEVSVRGEARWCTSVNVQDWNIDLAATYTGPRDVLGSLGLQYRSWTATTNMDGEFNVAVPAPVIDAEVGDVSFTEPGSSSFVYLPGQYSVHVATGSNQDEVQETVTFIQDPQGIFATLAEQGFQP